MPHRQLLIGFEVVKPAGFDGRDQFGEVVVELVEIPSTTERWSRSL
ncbi:MAG TPA: hypothetical protein VI094_23120 [Propionibacteriaceae bacterium]